MSFKLSIYSRRKKNIRSRSFFDSRDNSKSLNNISWNWFWSVTPPISSVSPKSQLSSKPFPNRLRRLLYALMIALLLLLLLYLLSNLLKDNKTLEDIKERITEKFVDKEYRWIIDEDQKNQLSWSANVSINPIIPWYYELITSDEKYLSWAIVVSDYPIPWPIEGTSLCSANDKYWNFSSKSWLDYNWFIYEYLNSKKTSDIVIAILDSWIDWNNRKLTSHLYTNTWENVDLIDSDNNWYIDDIHWVNIESWNWDISDDVGHGTHIAWIVLQTFPNAKLLPIKVNWDNKEIFNELTVIKWLIYAIEQWVDIINMSFWSRWMNIVEEELIKTAVEKWIIVIAAAGNDNENVEMYYPASYDWTLSVASYSKNWLSDFSNYWADVEMPWECIYSYWIDNPYVYMGWTSMSAPHLAWVVWWYMSLWNSLTWENSIEELVENNSVKNWDISVLKMPKLLWIEDQNNHFYEYLHEIHEILSSINEKLISLNDNITPDAIKSTMSYIEKNKWKLSTSADKIEKLYNDLWITDWFWVSIKNSLDEYLNFLSNLLDANSVQLTVTDRYLMNSLWVQTCSLKTWNEYCSTDDKRNWCDDIWYPWYICWRFDPIINKWELLPSSWTKSYRTMEDYQTELMFEIYQWEWKYAKANKKLWQVLLKWLPSKLKWLANADVYFTIDKYWYLSVSAVDGSNGNNKISTKVVTSTEEKMSETEEMEKIKNNLKTALDESKKMVNEIEKFYVLDPDNYIK